MEVVISCFVITLCINFIFMFAEKVMTTHKVIKVKSLNGMDMPFKAMTDGAVCADCYSKDSLVISAGERANIPLGFALELPDFMEAVIRPRSGLSKKGIDVQIGTIDTDYRGEVSCTVINNSGKDFYIAVGFRICQIAFREVPALKIKKVYKLSKTERGANGFGSTGVE